MNYETIPVGKLIDFDLRQKRTDVLKRLEERIKTGYNPARPLSVIAQNGEYLVADGNHRLDVIRKLGISEVPCVVYPEDTDPYGLGVSCNQDEDTYAPMDLFDWLDVISRLRDEGLTQAQIGKRVGWSREQVRDYIAVLSKIGAQILELAKQCQTGRAPEKGALAPFNFTEGWFRASGLYDLREKYQLLFMQRFIADKCKWSKDKIQKETARYRLWQRFIEIAKTELANPADLEGLIALIENDTFKTEEQLRRRIADLNKKAKNKLICGDAVVELEKLEDASIDLVITDPPYGIEYKSNRSQFGEHVTKEGVSNDSLAEALDLLGKTCKLLERKTKPDAHLYFFVGWQTEPDFRHVIKRYFDIKNVIIWDKGNHGCGDLKGAWGNQYEMIIFATKGQKALNKRCGDIIRVPRLSSDRLIHPTQKPVELIKELLQVSAQKADTACDPFMGSGSTIKAIKEYGGLNYIGIELDCEIYEKARVFIGGDNK